MNVYKFNHSVPCRMIPRHSFFNLFPKAFCCSKAMIPVTNKKEPEGLNLFRNFFNYFLVTELIASDMASFFHQFKVVNLIVSIYKIMYSPGNYIEFRVII